MIKRIFLWGAVVAIIATPIAAAAFSPLLAWRGPAYIVAGFAGIFAMAFLLVQPLLAGRFLPGLSPRRARFLHRVFGSLLLAMLAAHIGGLWITSPPDVVDVFLFRSPTPFSEWGMIGLVAILAAALTALWSRKVSLRTKYWRTIHFTFALIAIVASAAHAMLIEGTMETWSKAILCLSTVLIAAKLGFDLFKASRTNRRN